MNDAADAYLREHLDAANAVRWPVAEREKVDVAQTLLGLWLVGKCDSWYEHGRDLLTNPEPAEPYVRPTSQLAVEDRAYRDVFATLDPQQRAAVLRLLDKVIDGTMFGALVTLDQLAHAEVTVDLGNRDGEPAYSVRAVPGHNGIGIHERWSEWLSRFGGERP